MRLETPRLVLREWQDGDAEDFAGLAFDAEVMRYLLPFADRAASDAWVAAQRRHWREHGFGAWVVALSGDERLVGVVGLSHLRWALPFAPAVEVAWRLARECWGRGYAAEAARAAIDDGFARLGLAEIVAFTLPDNAASRRVMEKLGMTRDPGEDFDFDHPRMPPGHPWRRHVLYRLTAPAAPV